MLVDNWLLLGAIELLVLLAGTALVFGLWNRHQKRRLAEIGAEFDRLIEVVTDQIDELRALESELATAREAAASAEASAAEAAEPEVVDLEAFNERIDDAEERIKELGANVDEVTFDEETDPELQALTMHLKFLQAEIQSRDESLDEEESWAVLKESLLAIRDLIRGNGVDASEAALMKAVRDAWPECLLAFDAAVGQIQGQIPDAAAGEEALIALQNSIAPVNDLLEGNLDSSAFLAEVRARVEANLDTHVSVDRLRQLTQAKERFLEIVEDSGAEIDAKYLDQFRQNLEESDRFVMLLEGEISELREDIAEQKQLALQAGKLENDNKLMKDLVEQFSRESKEMLNSIRVLEEENASLRAQMMDVDGIDVEEIDADDLPTDEAAA